ncbi:hypothetical protein HDV05_005572 [Chytridiales sp. JEL 0842]|nr:hypothetical protein HDV05_005572 [Chytridiales sp. JEL 0842]
MVRVLRRHLSNIPFLGLFNSIVCTANNVLPRRKTATTRNLWDRFPAEIRNLIIHLSDPLTQYLHSYGQYAPENIRKATESWMYARMTMGQSHEIQRTLYLHTKRHLQNEIWRVALQIEWDGDFEQLPGHFEPEGGIAEWYKLVKSESMWRRLFVDLPARLESYSPCHVQLEKVGRSIAMRHCWTSLLLPLKTFEDIDKHKSESARAGHLQYLLYLEAHCGVTINDDEWTEASKVLAQEGGRLADIEYLVTKKPACITKKTLIAAAEGGHLETLQFLIEHTDFGCPDLAASSAARKGHMNVILYLHNHELDCFSTDAMDWAVEAGHFEIVKFLQANRSEGCSPYAFLHQSQGEILQFLERHYPNAKRAHDELEFGGVV